jgi:DNA mismatch endonuclease (patch repair protein)
MADVHTPERRSANMRAIRHKDTSPELQIRRMLFARGFRFRLHVRTLPGTPDIVLPKHKVVIFVHGCFWHGHGCHLFKTPGTRTDFWMAKIQSNRDRDFRNEAILLDTGWRVLSIWECALKGRHKRSEVDLIEQISAWILAGETDVPNLDISHSKISRFDQ